MTHVVNERMDERLKRRKRRVCTWLEHNRHRRLSLTREDADGVAYRVGGLLDKTSAEHGTNRGEIAGRAFGLDDIHAAHEKLRHYAYPRQLRGTLEGRTFSRTLNYYCLILQEVSNVTGRPFDDLALEVFGGISVVRTTEDPYGSELAARRFTRLLDQLAERLAQTHRLADYYRAVMTNGVVRDLTHDAPWFDPRLGGDLTSWRYDCAEAALPATDALDDDPTQLLTLPLRFQGRLPATPLYRLRVSRPAEVELHFVDGDGPGDLPRQLQAWVAYHWEIRLGVGPRNNGTASAMFFETAPLCLIHLTDPSLVGSLPHGEADTIIRPEMMYELSELCWPNSELTLRYGQKVLRANVLDVATGDWFDDGHISITELHDVSFPVILDATGYGAAGAINSWHFLVELPEAYWDRLHILYPSGGEGVQPLGGFFPPDTVGEWLERQLRQEGSILERDLGKRFGALRDALNEVREERWAAAAGDQAATKESARGEEKATEHLWMDARTWREGLGLSQKEAANLLGIVPRSLREYERGGRRLPHALRLAMLLCWLHPDLARDLATYPRDN